MSGLDIRGIGSVSAFKNRFRDFYRREGREGVTNIENFEGKTFNMGRREFSPYIAKSFNKA